MAISDGLIDIGFGVFSLFINTMDFVADDLVTGECFKKKKEKSKAKKIAKRELSDEEKKYGEDVDKNAEFMEIMIVEEKEDSSSNTFTVKKEDDNILLNNLQVNELLSAYIYREKILAAGLLFICKKVTDQQVGALLSAIDPDEQNLKDNIETLNSITKFYTGNCFATNCIYEDKEFGIDPKELYKVVRDITGLDILKNNSEITNIIEKTKKYVTEKTGCVPFIFNNSKFNSDDSTASEQTKRKVEGFVGDLLKDFVHTISYNPNNDLVITINITYDPEKSPRQIFIDPGKVFGEYKVLIPDINGVYYYSSDKDLIKKFIIENYRLSDPDICKIKVDEHQFVNGSLYGFYDIHASQSKINTFSREDINTLDGRLNFIIGMLNSKYGLVPRMRIKNLKDCNNFIIVSDNKITSPAIFPSAPEFPGLNIKVSEENFEIVIKDPNGNIMSSEKMQFGQEYVDAYNDLKVSFENVEKVAQMDANYNRINNPANS